ncbi:hypothetical protein I302_104893 [Kwoniella bestiolae CBS 10118]|uniref:NAD-dependent epimerase/dehydratase domain-containing protein n=1 Tax=Kwoniella bestiolae CBS 10118 TaxID=1296100 RepID=A0A1B9FRF8_9TREE|nr:hypothetical protein I302_09036 [Kwoniella bestiolae CBS 10118]OCF21360.1 hypothetical protein I302_09036 [Kwoniella bestiolae CBS 10118]
MQILLTGSSGVVGTYVLLHLLKEGHKVIAVDRIPLPPTTLTSLQGTYQDLDDILKVEVVDLTSIGEVISLFSRYTSPPDDTPSKSSSIDGVIHLAAIPHPEGNDARFVHNTNTSISYNVLYTAAEHGIRRIVQASSVNFTGLAYTRKGMQRFDKLPIDEDEPSHAEDPYALSKQICEIQALSLCRLHPSLTIASLRFHHVLPTLAQAVEWSREEEFWMWTSSLSAAQACIMGLTTPQEGRWKGHEAFNIVAPEIAWRDATAGSLELLGKSEWNDEGRIGLVDREWWEGGRRRGFWDCTKAERLLGWRHV